MFYAHSKKNLPPAEWQPLRTHLHDAAVLASAFAAPFSSAVAAWLCAVLHDIGKYAKLFQDRLHGGKRRVDHSLAGAVEARRLLTEQVGSPVLGMLLAHVISGHHTGLANGVGSEGGDTLPTLRERLDGASALPDYSAWRQEIGLEALIPPDVLPADLSASTLMPLRFAPAEEQQLRLPFALYLWTKMLYSCLVDADFLDTEHVLAPDKGSLRGQYPPLSRLKDALDAHLADKTAMCAPTEVNARRQEVLAACRAAGRHAQGIFSLTVPTGGGKTLSSLAFALEHAKEHGLQRIIYVIPYTSIIEQTADVFREALGPELAHAVVEHHSNVDWEPLAHDAATADDQEDPRTLAWENWDAPIIVTTSVQFFESLFAARSSSCRKLHNIAGSVVILDEAQTLPLPYLRPCLAVLHELAARYKTSVVLCTATQPALHQNPWLREGLENVREIIPDVQRLFTGLKRVQVGFCGELDDQTLVERLKTHAQVLCIVNTRAHARALCEALTAEGLRPFHLSTWMHPAHRRRVLTEIRACLPDNPCLVIATSLMEAGVDISFPVVYRALSGLDSVAQAAGRCNREGNPELGQIWVFATKHLPRGEQQRRAHCGRRALAAHADPLMPEAVRTYFEDLYSLSHNALDSKDILGRLGERYRSGCLPFRSIARDFKIIDEDTRPVLAPDTPEARKAVERLKQGFPSRAEARRLQQWTVSLRVSEWKILKNSGVLQAYGRSGQWHVLENLDLYDAVFGLDVRNPTYRNAASSVM